MQSITPIQLQQKITNKEEIFLIDVRETFEHEDFNIGGVLIPLNEVIQNINQIPIDRPVILYCKKGIRSHIAIERLQQKFAFTNLINLEGGIEAWKREIK